VGHKRTVEPRSCGSGKHKWKWAGNLSKDILYSQLMANYLGPWRICAVCRFATSEHLQPEGWDWRSDEVVTISDGGIHDNDHLVRSRSEQDYEHDRRA